MYVLKTTLGDIKMLLQLIIYEKNVIFKEKKI